MRTLLTLLLLIGLNQIFGQTEQNTIDIELENCLDSAENFTTRGMTNCIFEATTKWDKELNRNYSELTALLTEEQKEMLKIAQRKWIEFRDKEIEFSNQMYGDMEGTMWIPVAAQTNLELTKNRALELKSYANNLLSDQ